MLPTKRTLGCSEVQDVCELFNAILIAKYVSFARCRLPGVVLMETFPEAANLSKLFSRKAIRGWRDLMDHHNTAIDRGIRMKLLPALTNIGRLKFRKLETYMLTMHRSVVAEALLAIASFGERALRAKQESYENGVWCIELPFLITQDRWISLCKRSNILVLAIACKVSRADTCPSLDSEELTRAMEKVSSIFGA
jgi:hypothetical protein